MTKHLQKVNNQIISFVCTTGFLASPPLVPIHFCMLFLASWKLYRQHTNWSVRRHRCTWKTLHSNLHGLSNPLCFYIQPSCHCSSNHTQTKIFLKRNSLQPNKGSSICKRIYAHTHTHTHTYMYIHIQANIALF